MLLGVNVNMVRINMLESDVEVFPPFAPKLDDRQKISKMDVISNLEVTKDFEFDHEYISEMVSRFSLTPILCNKCNDLSRHFLQPSNYINDLYVKNARWVKNEFSVMSMDVEPYKSLVRPIYDMSNVSVRHPSSSPSGKINLVRDLSMINDKKVFL